LSLHNIQTPDGSTRWVREESLSKVKQVEVLTQDAIRIESELEYVRNVKSRASLAAVPNRIIARYQENFQYLVNHVTQVLDSLRGRGQSTQIKDKLTSVFGFRKVFLMLTDVGKLVAV
jgi:hypothetical protein